MSTRSIASSRHAGLTLIELIMFVVIVGVGLTGILAVLNVTAKSSADPMIRKNMLAVAEALLEEVRMMPFTYCDPNDANAATATSATVGAGGCAATLEQMGPEAGETRTSGATPFNNVNDYYVVGGLSLASPIGDISNTYVAPPGYSATIQIVAENLNDIVSNPAPASLEALRIAVTVGHGSDSITLEGYRTRYAPNSTP